MLSVEQIKEKYKEGTRVKLIEMKGEPQMPKGLVGVARCVDDIGQIHVDWDNGSTLALTEGDNFIVDDRKIFE